MKDICQKHTWKQKAQTARGYKMDKICIECGIKETDVFPATTFEGFIRRWVHGKLTDRIKGNGFYTQSVCSNYRCNDHELYFEGKGRNIDFGKDVLAIKLPDGRIIGNASQLPRCGSYRRGAEAPAQRVMQQLEMPLVPFNVFDEAKLNIKEAIIIAQDKSEELLLPKLEWDEHQKQLMPMMVYEDHEIHHTPEAEKKYKNNLNFKIKEYQSGTKYIKYTRFHKDRLEKRHFIGAMILEVQDKQFLFDVDRNEIKHYRFNAFLSQLPKKAKNVKEAYNILKPQEIKDAEKRGLKCPRQGEWFFCPAKLPKEIPADQKDISLITERPDAQKFDLPYGTKYRTSENFEIRQEDIRTGEIKEAYRNNHMQRIADYNKFRIQWLEARKRVTRSDFNKYAIRGELRAGQNRPNYAEKFLDIPEGVFVKGMVTHSGREHEPIMLNDWHKPVPNTAIASFTIRGNID